METFPDSGYPQCPFANFLTTKPGKFIWIDLGFLTLRNMNFLFGLLFFILMPTINAQDSLALSDCLKRAEANHPRRILSSKSLEAADLALQEANRQSYPQINFKGSVEYAPITKHFGYDPALTNGGLVGSQIVVEQPIYDGGKRKIKIEQMELEFKRSQLEGKLSRGDLLFEVEIAFIDLLRLTAEAKIKTHGENQLGEYLNLVTQMHAAGQSNYTDVLKTRLQYSAAESESKATLSERRAAQYTLAELMGSNLEDTLSIKGDLKETAPDEFLVDAVQKNPELELAELDLQSIQLAADLEKAELKPTLSLAGDMGLLTSWENLQASSANRANMWGASLGLHLDLPLYAWGLTGIHTKQKKMELEMSSLRKETYSRSHFSEWKKLLLQWQSSRARCENLHQNLSLAWDNFLLTKAKYAGGMGLASEVLEAHRLWLDNELDLIKSQTELKITLAKIHRLNLSK